VGRALQTLPGRAWAAVCSLVAFIRSKQKFAEIGDLPLEGGCVLGNCRGGYRTFGALDQRRGNAVLLVPWFMACSSQLAGHVGKGRLIDGSHYYVIAVDGLGGGVSSSPCTSQTQPGAAFPTYTIRDTVEAQRRLIEELCLVRLHTVVGTSLGGMQVFEWITAHRDAVERALAIAGSPRVTDAERRRWREQGRYEAVVPTWKRAAQAALRANPIGAWRALHQDPADLARQAKCLAGTDVTARSGGSLPATAAAVRAGTLIVVSPADEVVDPGPAAEFARHAGAALLQLEGRGGHDAPATTEGPPVAGGRPVPRRMNIAGEPRFVSGMLKE